MAELDLRGGTSRRKAIDAAELTRLAFIRRRAAMQATFITIVAFMLIMAILAMAACTVPFNVEKPEWSFKGSDRSSLSDIPPGLHKEIERSPCGPLSITPN